MSPTSKLSYPWAVFMAGGDGTRLQSLTRRIAGDFRPKQFCRLFDGKSLLEQTRARVEPLVHPRQHVFVVTRHHEMYYREELEDTDDSRILVQPSNRGTGLAMALAIVHVLARDPEAIVAFFPCDHYYSDNDAFASSMRSAGSLANEFPSSIVLLGAEATYPEVEYGWIEPGRPVSRGSARRGFQVNRFWEKPNTAQAEELLRRGCLWNTFVTVGRATAFLDLLRSRVPETVAGITRALVENDLESAYRRMDSVDFSREVLTPESNRLLVVHDRASGWMDLGSPTRLLDALARRSIRPAWLRELNSERDESTLRAGKEFQT